MWNYLFVYCGLVTFLRACICVYTKRARIIAAKVQQKMHIRK